MSCRSGCATKDHATWGECARAANLSTMVGEGVQINQQGERDLAEYARVRKMGIQPKSVKRSAVEAAKKAEGA